ncbi:hypothetical protein QR680_006367 [Steinernema hermaphroditum]|uniref:Uncharacterized protein n=1 Tax=Steinernema hermaphroditum TaxID=289476 RepID=A0AA39HVA9_9BILA|nr:hypothetical protein QR680_006367 [Steinernema hermaphroditum]
MVLRPYIVAMEKRLKIANATNSTTTGISQPSSTTLAPNTTSVRFATRTGLFQSSSRTFAPGNTSVGFPKIVMDSAPLSIESGGHELTIDESTVDRNWMIQSTEETDSATSGGTTALIIVMVVAVVIVIVGIIIFVCYLKRKKAKARKGQPNGRDAKTLSQKDRPSIGYPVRKRSSTPRSNSRNKNRQPVGAPQASLTQQPIHLFKPRPSHEKIVAQQSPTSTPVTALATSSSSLHTAGPIREMAPLVEEDQRGQESSPRGRSEVASMGTDNGSVWTGSTEGAVTATEKKYVCYENGAWQKVDRDVNSQFSFHLESDHTFSADF